MDCSAQENPGLISKTHIYEFDTKRNRMIDIFNIYDLDVTTKYEQMVYCHVIGNALLINYYSESEAFKSVIIDLQTKKKIDIPDITNNSPDYIYNNDNYLFLIRNDKLAIYKKKGNKLVKIRSNIKVIDSASMDYFDKIIVSNDFFCVVHGYHISIYSLKNDDVKKIITLTGDDNRTLLKKVIVSGEDVYYEIERKGTSKIFCYSNKTKKTKVIFTRPNEELRIYMITNGMLIISDVKDLNKGHFLVYNRNNDKFQLFREYRSENSISQFFLRDDNLILWETENNNADYRVTIFNIYNKSQYSFKIKYNHDYVLEAAVKNNLLLIQRRNKLQIYKMNGELMNEFLICTEINCTERILIQTVEYNNKLIIYSYGAGELF